MIQIKHTNRFSLGLMVGSLIVLLVFQVFWLENEYQQEKQRLQHEADRLFMNSVRHIEDSLFNEVLVQPLIFGLKSNQTQTTGFPNRLKIMSSKIGGTQNWADSSAKVTISGTFSHTELSPEATERKDSSLRFVFRSKGEKTENRFRSERGNLSLFIALSDSAESVDSVIPHIQRISIKSMLEKNFEQEITGAKIPLEYHIIASTESDSIFSGLLSHQYTDLPSDQNYFVQFPEYKGYVIQRIIPQILFSIFLFLCISLAYLIIYRSLKKQQRLNQLKNDFISNITHELKTPITTVGVAIEAMRNFHALQNPERTREYLDISRKELNRLALLVDKVLKMSMFEHTEPQLKFEILDFSVLIEQILNSMRLQFDKIGAILEVDLPVGNFQLRGDQTHLTSVVYNLIDNALKYRSENPLVRIELVEKERVIQLIVSDNGPGIAPEYQEKIFEKFFRVPSGNQHNTKGYGLGLAYVAGVIDKHQGTIQVNSKPGAGTRFTIELPKANG
ncbi:MAG: HAMP domain-containing histidine kinase [Bacteroidetes bacterium]|nr:HAMP domain-containing histidine kinase [Bacteroidota bacterium]MCB0841940.1 HAMP domain-containing histidine kinase [Bacteroidota bacterium]MCB0855958.1 HAMP domain-containing histidine kinase [Bacteroidota bacterium]